MNRTVRFVFSPVLTVLLTASAASAQGTYTVLQAFERPLDGVGAPLTVGPDGKLYAITQQGGAYLRGGIIRVDVSTSPATVTTVYSFTSADGRFPNTQLTLATDGYLYGTADGGSAGTIFRVNQSGAFATVATLSSGLWFAGRVIQASDGNLYALAGDTYYATTLIRVTPEGAVTPVATFTWGTISNPNIVEGADGAFYGTTRPIGDTVFRVTTAGDVTTFANFHAIGLSDAKGALILGTDGNLYGTTSSAVFRVTPAGVVSQLASVPSGCAPGGGLMQAADGHLYGTASDSTGCIFRVTMAGVATVVLTRPNVYQGPLTQAPDGCLYATSVLSGSSDPRAILRVDVAAPSVTDVGTFTVPGIANPRALIKAANGDLIGVSAFSAEFPYGTVFRLATAGGALTTLASFTSATGRPLSIMQASNGNFYGTTNGASPYGYGATVFELTPAGVLTTLGTFPLSGNAETPRYPLVEGSDGALYGTTPNGGVYYNSGTIYRVALGAAPTLTTVATFTGVTGSVPGNGPTGPLVAASDGSLYGMTGSGGAPSFGTIFRYTPGEGFSTILSFSGVDLGNPMGPLVQGADGDFYGVSYLTTDSQGQTVFRMTSAGSLSKVFSFDPHLEQAPRDGLFEGAAGELFGTVEVSAYGAEYFYRVKTTGARATLKTWTSPDHIGRALASSPREFYGVLESGGPKGGGVIFRWANAAPVATSPYTAASPLYVEPGTIASRTLSVTDADDPTASLAFRIVSSPSHGTAVLNATTGLFTYTPAAGYMGPDSFTYTVADSFGDSAIETVFIRVGNNEAPTVTPVPNQTIDEDGAATVYFNVADDETPDVSLNVGVSPTAPPAPFAFTSTITAGAFPGGFNRRLVVTPAADQSGVLPLTISVADGNNGTATTSFTITVTPVNDAPAITAIAGQTIDEDTSATVFFTASDVETAEASLVVSAGPAVNPGSVPATYAITAGAFPGGFNRRLVVTPAANANGTQTVTVSVTDAGNLTTSRSFTLTVNAVDDAPTISGIADRAMNENTISGPIAFAVGDVDDPETITNSWVVSASSSNATLLPAGALIVNGSGGSRTLTIAPAHDQSGSAVVTVTFQSKSGSTVSDTFTMTVNAVDRAPSIQAQPGNRGVRVGRDVWFSAAADGRPAPAVQWQVSTNGGATWADVEAATSATYAFRAAAIDNGKRFRAVFTNVAGSATTGAARLIVGGPLADVDGDGRDDMTLYDAASGKWRTLTSASGYATPLTTDVGGAGCTPVPGDYDGDGLQDVAVYDDTSGAWTIVKSSGGAFTIAWGGALYRPVPGDYDGDGKTDLGVYRVSTGGWFVLLSSTNYTTSLSAYWGGGGYVPVPGQDFDGDGLADIAAYSQSAGTWYVLESSTHYTTSFIKAWGGVGYTLVPGDYDGDGRADLGLYKRSTGTWTVLLSGVNFTTSLIRNWGGVGEFPVAGDFDGDGTIDLGTIRRATGAWQVLFSAAGFTTSLSGTTSGTTADQIVSTTIVPPAGDVSRATDFDNDGKADITVYNPMSGGWSTLLSAGNFLGATNALWGSGGGYTAVPGDYDGDGRTDRGVYENATGNWTILLSSDNFTTVLNVSVGGAAWSPMPGDYDGDGRTDLVVYNASTGQWYGLLSSTSYATTVNVVYGGAGYTPVTGDFDGDGKTDLGVYQASSGHWSILLAAAHYTTSLTATAGGPAYVPAHGDYDGDGKTDFTVYNPATGEWSGLLSSTHYSTAVNLLWGGPGYTPVQGDYDGDGRTDLALYVQATGGWYILLSGAQYTTSLSRTAGGVGYVAEPRYR